MAGIVVVGAGQAGSALVMKLRALGHDGPITLVGDEVDPPYQRPPLSKKYLLGEMTRERLYLRPQAAYADQDIALLSGRRVTGINAERRTVGLGDTDLDYDTLVLTTGAVPRRLPAAIGGDLAGVHVIRTLADADGMADEFRPGRRVLIVGGGYIGLEAAAVAAERGLQVTLIEAAPRILQRVASPQTAAWFRQLHARHGVNILEGTGLSRLTGEDRVTGATLDNGTRIDVDFVIVGIGITPATALAEAAGLTVDDGIVVDAQGRTSAPGIWASGDCAAFPFGNTRIRLESVQNAIDQSETVAQNLMGAERDYRPVPWFWSDQFDVKLQIAGLNHGYDRVVERRAADGMSYWYFSGQRLCAVDAMNAPRAYMIGKRLLEAGSSVHPDAIADPGCDLKSLLA